MVEVFEVLSVAMTSSPEVAPSNFLFMNSGVFEYTDINSELHYPIVYGPSLRSASVLTLIFGRNAGFQVLITADCNNCFIVVGHLMAKQKYTQDFYGS